MASRNASRMVMVTISVPSGTSGSGDAGAGGGFAVPVFAGAGAGVCGFFRRLPALRPRGGAGGARAAVSLSADLSSPSARIMAIGVLTATSLVPSGTRILPSVPSSTASTSMVALSVSISAITSPDLDGVAFLLEPLGEIALLHGRRERGHEDLNRHGGLTLAGSLDAGPRRACGRSTRTLSPIDVRIKFGRVGLGIVGGEFGRFVDDGAHRRRRFSSVRPRSPISWRAAARAPARSDRARCAPCRPLPWSGIWPGRTSSGRDSGRSSFR